MPNRNQQQSRYSTLSERVRKAFSGFGLSITILVILLLLWVLPQPISSPEGKEQLSFLIIGYAVIIASGGIITFLRRQG